MKNYKVEVIEDNGQMEEYTFASLYEAARVYDVQADQARIYKRLSTGKWLFIEDNGK